jgi:hypothetical protein
MATPSPRQLAFQRLIEALQQPFASPYEFALRLLRVSLYFIAAFTAKLLLEGMYNTANHPLVDFPGPKWAAFSDWYKTYYELYLGKNWIEVLEALHAKYGLYHA